MILALLPRGRRDRPFDHRRRTCRSLLFFPIAPHFRVSVPFAQWLFDPFTVMPIQMFNWVSRPQDEFHINAAAAGVILRVMTLVMNAACHHDTGALSPTNLTGER